MVSKPNQSAKTQPRNDWLTAAMAQALRRDAQEALSEKKPLKMNPVVNNGFTLPSMQNNIVFNHAEVGLRAAVAMSSREPDIIMELARDKSSIVRIALLDSNPNVTPELIMAMGSEAVRNGEEGVLEAAKGAMLRREESNSSAEVKAPDGN